ncbi:MAG: transglycosylase domain-containing protein [Elusimicrobia bacterium]|nr:transglycosylase domain-containing protein [Elusimicrobiota bacterium]
MTRARFYTSVSLILFSLILVSAGTRRLLSGLPDIRVLEDYTPPLTTRLFDIKGNVIAELSIERRALLPLSRIPEDLQNAVIAVEDDQFFRHWGVSPRGMLRSALVNLTYGRVRQGGSTITQQLALQVFLKRERQGLRKWIRKIREILLAIQIERNFSKPEILQLYLNQVYFGEGAYGVQSAARIYFGKEVSELNLADCALLAGLIRAPRANSPFFSPDNAFKRRWIVLQRMNDEGMISSAQRDEAHAIPLPTEKHLPASTEAPYFVEHVRRRLERRYGTQAVWKGGLRVYTTLDLDMQKTAEAIMEKGLAEFDERALKEWQSKMESGALAVEGVELSTSPPAKIQGAFTVIDVKTGAIYAMIGGRDSVFNRAVQARRQPGSTFKAFVWAAALGSGMSAATLVEDTPVAYYSDGRDWRLLEGATDQYAINLATAPFAQSPDFKIWVPGNFDGKYLGVITLRKALALSRNVVSVRLIEQIGPPVVVDIAHRAGIRSELDPVPALGLGSSVVSPLEMTSALATFGNGGIYVLPYTIARVEDNTGKELEKHVPSEKEVMTPQLAYLTTNLLKGVVTSGTGSHAARLRRPLAGKTGTSNDNRDLWFIGYTPDLVAGAWMGYDDFASLGRKDWTGGSTVVPWWTEIMDQILKDYPKRDFSVPSGVGFHKIDKNSGMLALPGCPRNKVILEAFLEGSEPKQFCTIDHTLPEENQIIPSPQILTAPALTDLPPSSHSEESRPPLSDDDMNVLEEGAESDDALLLQ